MESVLVPLGFFGLFAYVVHVVVSAIVRGRQISKQSQLITRLIESAGPEARSADFLTSPAGRAIFDATLDRRTLMLGRVVSAVQTCIVLTVTGVVLILLRPQVSGDDERATLWAMGLIAIAIGVAFLLAASAAYALSKRWGMLDQPTN